jgi:hypothetical protein
LRGIQKYTNENKADKSGFNAKSQTDILDDDDDDDIRWLSSSQQPLITRTEI